MKKICFLHFHNQKKLLNTPETVKLAKEKGALTLGIINVP